MPKSEIRNPNAESNPKSETRVRIERRSVFRISVFEFLSDFEDSDFGFFLCNAS